MVDSSPKSKSPVSPQGPRACWTCRDRRIKCDRTLPHCKVCTKSERKCLGYGLRLSWPRGTDPKRFIVAPHVWLSHGQGCLEHSSSDEDETQYDQTQAILRRKRSRHYWFINTGSIDIDVYRALVASRGNRGYDQVVLAREWKLDPETPLLWRSLYLGDGSKPLLQHFYTIGYTSIPTFSAYSTSIRSLLIRMAFSSNSTSSMAMRYGMLAVASEHRGDEARDVMGYKLSALRALATSVESINGDTSEAARHVAAVMLLSSMQGYSECGLTYSKSRSQLGNEWLQYVRGAREVVKTSGLAGMVCSSLDLSELMDWIYHMDVFSRLTTFHWRRAEGAPQERLNAVPEYEEFRHAMRCPKPGPHVLALFHQVFNFMLDSDSTDCRSRDEQAEELQQLRDLIRSLDYESQLRMQTVPNETKDEMSLREETQMPSIFEMYRMSALVCLSRVAESRFGCPSEVDALLGESVQVMNRLDNCQRQFPLFVLGSEAQTDEQRWAVMQLIDRSMADPAGRSMTCLRKSMEFMWVQKDLHADEDLLLDFSMILRTVCGNCLSVPNLA